MTALMELFDQEHDHLSSDYKDASGERPEFSISVATRIASKVLDEGLQPAIVGIINEACDSDDCSEWLIPKRYGGRVMFGAYIVCMVGDIIYDPMLPRPVRMDEYPNEAFGANLEFVDITPSTRIGQAIQTPSTSHYLSPRQATIQPAPDYL